MNKLLAQKLLERVKGTIEYNINIIDEKGMIIASSDKSREGSFHEAAYNMMQQGIDLVEINEDQAFHGTKKGVNMTIVNQGKLIGVVGITGDPEEVRPLATLLKISVEVLYEIETQQMLMQKRQSMKERFFNQLLFSESSGSKDLDIQATNLGYSNCYIRIPILISTSSENIDQVREKCKSSQSHTKQDIFIVASNSIVVFLHLPDKNNAAGVYRERVESYIEDIESQKDMPPCTYCVGTLQSDFGGYHDAYVHVRWLKDYFEKDHKVRKKVEYFYNYVREYLSEKIAFSEKKSIFDTYVRSMEDGFWGKYTEIVGAIYRNDDNLSKAAESLHVHKNTLLYQYNKYRDGLKINPLGKSMDKDLSICLYDYLSFVKYKG